VKDHAVELRGERAATHEVAGGGECEATGEREAAAARGEPTRARREHVQPRPRVREDLVGAGGA